MEWMTLNQCHEQCTVVAFADQFQGNYIEITLHPFDMLIIA